MTADLHVHSEYSWDAERGDMLATCARAVELGLHAVAFTEHADFTPWSPAGETPTGIDARGVRISARARGDLDVEGYLACIAECRERHPSLRIRTGVELGEPHRFAAAAGAVLARAGFDVVLGSVHCVPDADDVLLDCSSPGLDVDAEVYRVYLREVLDMVESGAVFQVVAHLGYPRRYAVRALQEAGFEDETRAVLAAMAVRGLVLEVNSSRGRVLCPGAAVVRWWREAGGERVAFGGDAHEAARLGLGLEDCAAAAEAAGFVRELDGFRAV